MDKIAKQKAKLNYITERNMRNVDWKQTSAFFLKETVNIGISDVSPELSVSVKSWMKMQSWLV
jgi:hypothetical protein